MTVFQHVCGHTSNRSDISDACFSFSVAMGLCVTSRGACAIVFVFSFLSLMQAAPTGSGKVCVCAHVQVAPTCSGKVCVRARVQVAPTCSCKVCVSACTGGPYMLM